MLSLIAQVINPQGLAIWRDIAGNLDAAMCPPVGFKRDQPSDLALHFRHDTSWRLNPPDSVYLEEVDGLGLMMVALVDADAASIFRAGPWYVSDDITCKPLGDSTLFKRDAEIRELSFVEHTANCGTQAVRWSEGDLRVGTAAEPYMPLYWRDIWRNGADELTKRRYRRSGATMRIHGIDPPKRREAPAPPKRRPATVAPAAPPGVFWRGFELGGEAADYVLELAGFQRAADGSLIRL